MVLTRTSLYLVGLDKGAACKNTTTVVGSIACSKDEDMIQRNVTGVSTSTGQGPAHNPNKHIEATSPPTDSISSLTWSPAANLFVASSWDNQVRCWEVAQDGQSVPKAISAHDRPVLCTDWSPDGTMVFSGGCDSQAKMWNLATNQSIVVAKHDAPIRDLYCVEKMNNMLVTGSWDHTIRYWDLRQQNPAHIQQVPERVYSMDIKYPLLVVGTANRHIQVYNLTNPQTVLKQIHSPLKYQTRCVKAFPDATGYLVGSIEGRVAVHHLQDQQRAKDFTFKCHREGTDVYAVNSMAFHPQYEAFVTMGSDGAYIFWDKEAKQKLKAMKKANASIPCGNFNRDGNIFAYAVSYDWSRGHAEHNPATAKHYILLHSPSDKEIKNNARRR